MIRLNPEIVPGSRALKLSKGYIALVDEEDYERLSKLKWSANEQVRWGYVRAVRWDYGGGKTHFYLHQDVMGPAPEGHEIDHINRDPLDCRRCNLRFVTRQENMWNSKNAGKGKGVAYSRQHKGYIAYWDRLGHKRKYVPKSYPTEEAALAALEAFKAAHG